MKKIEDHTAWFTLIAIYNGACDDEVTAKGLAALGLCTMQPGKRRIARLTDLGSRVLDRMAARSTFDAALAAERPGALERAS